MNLGKQIVQDLILEADSTIKTIVAIYPGRFQPMGKHHAEVYKWLSGKFGKSNTYIATSDKVQLPKSPFSFNEKKKIISSYGIKNVHVKTLEDDLKYYGTKEIEEMFND